MSLRILIGLMLFIAQPFAWGAESIRVGVLTFGTLNWELQAMRDLGLEAKYGISVAPTPLASPEAGKIALQGGSVDVIVADWIWAAGQRARDTDLAFVPYSANHGALMVPAESKIQSLSDLAGKRLGIAGGGLDKNWLLLRAVGQKSLGRDLDTSVAKSFAAPPLLLEQLRAGRLDAVLTYWNQAAELESHGYRQLLDGRGMLQALGIEATVPALGYIFHDTWAGQHPNALTGFLEAGKAARQAICDDDAAWTRIAHTLEGQDDKVRAALRRHYCQGSVGLLDQTQIAAAERIYGLVGKLSGNQIGNSAGKLPNGLFWQYPAGTVR